MQAAWYEAIGSAEGVLHVGEIDNPSPLEGEVLVEVKASGVNPSDVKTRAGARGELQFPRIIPHSDGGGIIVEVGEGVSEDRVGERVWIWNGAFGRAHGTCAELMALPSSQAVAMSEDVSYETAACLGIPASTAYYGVFSDGPVEDKAILITGVAGFLGSNLANFLIEKNYEVIGIDNLIGGDLDNYRRLILPHGKHIKMNWRHC